MDDLRRLKGAWVAMTERPYWRRLWVLQELVLSEDRQVVLYGDCKVSIYLITAFKEAWGAYQSCGRLYTRLELPVDEWTLPNRSNPMYEMMFYFAGDSARDELWQNGLLLSDFLYFLEGLQCFDSRDRIHGIIEIVNWGSGKDKFHGPPVVDYNKSSFRLMIDFLPIWIYHTGPLFTYTRYLCDILRLGKADSGAEICEFLRNDLLMSTAPASGRAFDLQKERCHRHQFSATSDYPEFCRQHGILSSSPLEGNLEITMRRTRKGEMVIQECPHPCQEIYIEGELIAILPSMSRPGDLLLRTASIDYIASVARRTLKDGQILEIIGAAVVRSDHDIVSAPETRPVNSHDSRTERDPSSDYDITFERDDVLRLVLPRRMHNTRTAYLSHGNPPAVEAYPGLLESAHFKRARFSSYVAKVNQDETIVERSRRRVCMHCGEVAKSDAVLSNAKRTLRKMAKRLRISLFRLGGSIR